MRLSIENSTERTAEGMASRAEKHLVTFLSNDFIGRQSAEFCKGTVGSHDVEILIDHQHAIGCRIEELIKFIVDHGQGFLDMGPLMNFSVELPVGLTELEGTCRNSFFKLISGGLELTLCFFAILYFFDQVLVD